MDRPICSIEAEKTLREHPDYRVLRRIPWTVGEYQKYFPLELNKPVGDEINLIIVDTETTGLDKNQHEMIELGLIKFTYSPSKNQVTKVLGCVSFFEQPKEPITEELFKVHGITNDMVAGHTFPVEQIQQIFSDVSLVIAHNASFDRGFFDKRFERLANLPWACSIKEVAWDNYGYEGSKLLYLLYQTEYFYSAHRADIDCIATLWLFLHSQGSLAEILSNSAKQNTIIRCFYAPYNVKDALKERGYRWQDAQAPMKHWYREVEQQELAEEMAWLSELCPNKVNQFTQEPITAISRYK